MYPIATQLREFDDERTKSATLVFCDVPLRGMKPLTTVW